MDVLNAGLDTFDHIPRIASPQHKHDSAHDFAVTVQHRRAVPHRMVDEHLSYISDEHRSSAGLLDHDAFDILERADQPYPSHDVLFIMFFEDIPAGVGIVSGDSIEDVAKRQTVFPQHARLDQHLILLDISTHRIDVDDLRCAFYEVPAHPVLNR